MPHPTISLSDKSQSLISWGQHTHLVLRALTNCLLKVNQKYLRTLVRALEFLDACLKSSLCISLSSFSTSDKWRCQNCQLVTPTVSMQPSDNIYKPSVRTQLNTFHSQYAKCSFGWGRKNGRQYFTDVLMGSEVQRENIAIIYLKPQT